MKKKPERFCFFVDTENVGMSLPEQLPKHTKIHLYVTTNGQKKIYPEWFSNKKVQIVVMDHAQLRQKNELDMLISADLAMTIDEEKAEKRERTTYILCSKDKGYDPALNMLRKKFPEALIQRSEKSLPDAISDARLSVEKKAEKRSSINTKTPIPASGFAPTVKQLETISDEQAKAMMEQLLGALQKLVSAQPSQKNAENNTECAAVDEVLLPGKDEFLELIKKNPEIMNVYQNSKKYSVFRNKLSSTQKKRLRIQPGQRDRNLWIEFDPYSNQYRLFWSGQFTHCSSKKAEILEFYKQQLSKIST